MGINLETSASNPSMGGDEWLDDFAPVKGGVISIMLHQQGLGTSESLGGALALAEARIIEATVKSTGEN